MSPPVPPEPHAWCLPFLSLVSSSLPAVFFLQPEEPTTNRTHTGEPPFDVDALEYLSAVGARTSLALRGGKSPPFPPNSFPTTTSAESCSLPLPPRQPSDVGPYVESCVRAVVAKIGEDRFRLDAAREEEEEPGEAESAAAAAADVQSGDDDAEKEKARDAGRGKRLARKRLADRLDKLMRGLKNLLVKEASGDEAQNSAKTD